MERKKRITKYVTKEMEETAVKCQAFKDGKVVAGSAIIPGHVEPDDLIGYKLTTKGTCKSEDFDGVICQIDEVQYYTQSYRMPLSDFLAAAEPYEKERRVNTKKEDKKK